MTTHQPPRPAGRFQRIRNYRTKRHGDVGGEMRVGKTQRPMPKTNQISATITPKEMEAIKSAIATIQSKLPFLVDIGTKEIRRMAKAGDLSEAFLQKALAIAEQSPDILPRNFAIEEFRADMALAASLEEITLSLQKLLERIGNTIIVARSDAYGHALITYDRSKKSATQGLHAATLDLGQRFTRRSQSKKTESDSAAATKLLS